MDYYQHSRQTKSSRPKKEVRQVALRKTQYSEKKWQKMRQRLEELDKELGGRTPLLGDLIAIIKRQSEVTRLY